MRFENKIFEIAIYVKISHSPWPYTTIILRKNKIKSLAVKLQPAVFEWHKQFKEGREEMKNEEVCTKNVEEASGI